GELGEIDRQRLHPRAERFGSQTPVKHGQRRAVIVRGHHAAAKVPRQENGSTAASAPEIEHFRAAPQTGDQRQAPSRLAASSQAGCPRKMQAALLAPRHECAPLYRAPRLTASIAPRSVFRAGFTGSRAPACRDEAGGRSPGAAPRKSDTPTPKPK